MALSFIYECRGFQENEYFVWVGPGIAKALNEVDFTDNFHFYYFDFGLLNLGSIRMIQRTLSVLEKKISPDVIISTSGPSYFHSLAPQIVGFNLPLYIYPESPFFEQLSIKKRLRLLLKKMIHFHFFKRDTAAYVVQTDDVNIRVRNALKTENVYTVTNTYSGFFVDPPEVTRKLPAREPGEIRLLTVSAYYPHKNLEIIPLVLKEMQLHDDICIKFIMTLDQVYFNRHMKHDRSILNVGSISNAECPSLYKECDIIFLPTLAECFSAAYPEAMIMGKPIITSDLPFARAICSNAALYVNPMNPAEIAEAIVRVITNNDLYGSLVEKGFERLKVFDTPIIRAAKYLNICERICSGNA